MNLEEMIKNLAIARTAAEAAAVKVNEAETIQAKNLAQAELDKIVSSYNADSQLACFMACSASPDGPMMHAIKTLTYPTIRAKEEKLEDSEITKVVIDDTEKFIDLRKLHKFCNGIGANKDWLYAVEKFNLAMACRAAKELGIDPKKVNDSFYMSQLAREIDLGENPVSNSKLIKTLQSIAAMMIGEGFKPTSHDEKYLLMVYTKKGRKALTVTCANHRYMTQYIMEILHRIVLDKSYELDYKKATTK